MALTRGVRFILTFIVLSVLMSVGAVVVTVFLVTRGPEIKSGSILWLRVPSNLAEREPDNLLGQLVGSRDTVGSVIQVLRSAKLDSRVEGVVLIPPLQQALWGKIQEIRDAVHDYKESGKPIVAYLEYGGGQQYYLATACDEIVLTPTSPLELVGVASYELFLRDALDKIGIYPDMLHAGDYKTASNLYTENTFTSFHREMSESLNRDLYDQLVIGIGEARGLTSPAVRAAIDDGPLLPRDAVSRGLVDGLAYEDQLMDRLSDGDQTLERLSFNDYRHVSAQALGFDDGPAIALIYAVGPITLGSGGVDVSGAEVVGSEAIVSAIRAAREDQAIEAIILRIDSPGGAAVASDIIWRELTLAREDKPVIASMSDVAASGGYYLAVPADVIVAQPATLTGSIGVFSGKFSLGDTLHKLGVNLETVSDGLMADMNSPVAPYTEEARRRVQGQIDHIYEEFLVRVAQGREMTRDAVHAVAQGRVWTGRQAQEVGLVDELGGLVQAIASAKEKAGIDPAQSIRLVTYPRPRTFLEMLSTSFTVWSGSVGPSWLNVSAPRFPAALALPLQHFRQGEPLALMPFTYLN